MDIAVEEAVMDKAGTSPAAAGAKPSKAAPKADAADQAPFPSSAGAQLVGQIVGLLTQSQAHRHLFLADLEWLIGPPMALRQFRLFHDGKQPVAVAFWASVSDEVEKELMAGRPRLRPDEWKSGNNLWLIDLVAPTLADKPKLVEGLIAELSEKVFSRKAFKMRARDPRTGKQSFVAVGPKTPKSSLDPAVQAKVDEAVN